MAAFSLKSDNQFITPIDDLRLFVRTYKGDMNDIKVIMRALYLSNEHWIDDGVQISATGGNDDYDSLEVFGTTIEGDKFEELCKELGSIEQVGIDVFVNRLGLCVITKLKHSSIKAMRINDYFGWSKYGVKVPHRDLISSSAMWNKFDMFSGETMLDVEGLVRTAGEAEELRRSLEEKNVELVACKNELEEKSIEITVLKKDLELIACKKELEFSKKIESLLMKVMEENFKIIKELTMKGLLLASKSD